VKRIDFEGAMFKKSLSWFRKKLASDLLQLRIFKEVQRAIQLNPSA
jgi:hypothetical protein